MSKYPGEIVDNVFCFQELKYKDSRGKVRVFRVFVRIIKETHHFADANWNILVEATMPFKEEYLEGAALPSKCYAQYWTEYGEAAGKIVRAAPKYPKKKNIGKKNERNELLQAMEEALAIYKKKKNDNVKLDIKQDAANPMVHPMLAGTKEGPVQYPIYCQAKLNGHRCIAFVNQKEEVILYTRGLKMWPDSPATDRIRQALLKPLLNMRADGRSVYLDGELYVHGLSLEEISRIRASDYGGPIQYNIFDCFDIKKNEPFEERWRKLLGANLNGDPIELVETVKVSSEAEEDKFFEKCLSAGYEGIMLREPDGKYKFSTHKNSIRSSGLLKRKPLFDAEFEVVGYTQGKKGKDVGAVVWICQTDGGAQFHVTPKSDYEQRRRLYKECVRDFEGKFQNRMMKVEYRELSDSGIPLRAKAIEFRDFE